MVIVNGVPAMEHGKPTGALPGAKCCAEHNKRPTGRAQRAGGEDH